MNGTVDLVGDRSPVLSKTPVENLLQPRLREGGFKASPGGGWVTDEMVARGEPGPLPRRSS